LTVCYEIGGGHFLVEDGHTIVHLPSPIIVKHFVTLLKSAIVGYLVGSPTCRRVMVVFIAMGAGAFSFLSTAPVPPLFSISKSTIKL